MRVMVAGGAGFIGSALVRDDRSGAGDRAAEPYYRQALAILRRSVGDAHIDTARAYPRIAPRGDAGAALMVLVPQPEESDRDRLMSGPQGRLLANILAAMGLEESEVYLAAALPCHTPMADLAMLARLRLSAVGITNVFGNDSAAQQVASVSGSVTQGFVATLEVGVAA